LVNNAGINGPQVPVEDYPLENWERVIGVDLTAVFLCTRAIVPHMKQVGYGRIVSIASQAGKEGIANVCAYNAAKAGVIGFMKGISSELASFGITANSITPTLAETDLMQEMSDDYIAGIKKRTLMGRLCQVEEVADMVAFVASPACSYSTGACFDVSGGRAQY
jgi:3-oxoacyl-[acyl-carrier protein] reductase